MHPSAHVKSVGHLKSKIPLLESQNMETFITQPRDVLFKNILKIIILLLPEQSFNPNKSGMPATTKRGACCI